MAHVRSNVAIFKFGKWTKRMTLTKNATPIMSCKTQAHSSDWNMSQMQTKMPPRMTDGIIK